MSDCRFGVSPVNYPDPDPEFYLLLIVRLHFTLAVITRSLLDGPQYMALNPSYVPCSSGSGVTND